MCLCCERESWLKGGGRVREKVSRTRNMFKREKKCPREGLANAKHVQKGEEVFASRSRERESWLKGGGRVREKVSRTRKLVKRGRTCS
ncbi:hypothetical protein NEOCIP111885_00338 [Pseudoneobacillus rhizosphaerae]|uniref:Uncharacterized protein n=1 Tax=Pseudoneobacillus rhizosphaerae TaxID=2880968 RepID=A0A9C7G6W9_9BACI|nr:hypothetical protein NEOCIP111885_00338 [Pseudoneobacillus rhizosphaerae]